MADQVRFRYEAGTPNTIELRNDAMLARSWRAEVVDVRSGKVVELLEVGDLEPGEERRVSTIASRPFLLRPLPRG
jgi:hypothetical protein